MIAPHSAILGVVNKNYYKFDSIQYIVRDTCFSCMWIGTKCERWNLQWDLFTICWYVLDMSGVTFRATLYVDTLRCCCYCKNIVSVFFWEHVWLHNRWLPTALTDGESHESFWPLLIFSEWSHVCYTHQLHVQGVFVTREIGTKWIAPLGRSIPME